MQAPEFSRFGGPFAAGFSLTLRDPNAAGGTVWFTTDGSDPRLTGGIGSLTTPRPVRTVASFWPYATTLFDYTRRAMPPTAPQSLTNDDVYAVTAYLLSVDGIVPPDARLDAASLPKVVMPNRDKAVSVEPKIARPKATGARR